MELSDLPGVGPATIEKLETAGKDTLLSIAVSSPAEIAEVTGMTEARARKLIYATRDALDFGFVSALDDEQKTQQPFLIPTGSNNLNELLAGGIPSGIVTEFFGRNGSGKTQLAHQLCVEIQKINPEHKVIYIDTEGSFSAKRIRQMANAYELDPDQVLNNIKKADVMNSDHQVFVVDKAEELIKQDPNIKLVIVDSIIDYFRNEYPGRGQLADRQQKLNKHVHSLTKLARVYNIVVYVTNQVMDDPSAMYGDPVKPAGGNILGHQSRLRAYLRKSSKGITTKLVKSKDLEDGDTIFQITNEGVRD